jgi:hypothetical protein
MVEKVLVFYLCKGVEHRQEIELTNCNTYEDKVEGVLKLFNKANYIEVKKLGRKAKNIKIVTFIAVGDDCIYHIEE